MILNEVECLLNNISYSSRKSNTSVEKENEQPNMITSDRSGHIKSDTVIMWESNLL